jgi:regulatory protein
MTVDERGYRVHSDDVRRPSPAPEPLTTASARTLVLGWLGQRELSSAQVRLRLRRRQCPNEVIAATITALVAEGALDDTRAARARARHDVAIKRRGPARVLQQVQALGVDRDTAREAVASAFADVDQDAMIRAAVERRLRGRPFPSERHEVAKLFAWLMRQGFDADRVSRILRKPSP